MGGGKRGEERRSDRGEGGSGDEWRATKGEGSGMGEGSKERVKEGESGVDVLQLLETVFVLVISSLLLAVAHTHPPRSFTVD